MSGRLIAVSSYISANKSYQFETWIERKIGNPEIRVQVINGHILLEGVANTPAEAQRAQLIAEMYTPNIVVDEAVADRKVLKVHPN